MARGFGSLETGMTGLTLGGDEQTVVQYAPKRYGKMGVPVDLLVNFFKIDINPQTPNYFHYNIEILKNEGSVQSAPSKGKGRKAAAQASQQPQQPKKDTTPKSKKMPKKVHDQVFAEMLKKHKNVFNCPYPPVFDGEKNFYSTTQFNVSASGWTGQVTVKDIDREESFTVNVTVPESSHGQNLKRLKEKDGQVMPIELQALDIIMRNGPRLCKISLGSNFFFKSSDPSARDYQFDIGRDRNRDPIKYGQFGHYQCAKKTEQGLVYNVDRAMAVFTEGGPIIGLVKDIYNNQLGQREKGQLEELIKGLKFRALHLNYSRTFIISGLSRDSVQRTQFTLDSDAGGQKTNVYDYFMKTYGPFCQRNRLNPNLPAIQVGGSRNAKYFPMEACELLVDEVYRRKLNPIQQGEVTRKSSQQTPSERFSGITKHIQTIEKDNTLTVGNQQVNYLQKFGIRVNAQPIQVKARILAAPQVGYRGEKAVDTKGQGQWDMRGCQFFQPSNIGNNWAVVNISRMFNRENRSSIYKNKVDNLVSSLIGDAKNKGINMSTPKKVDYNYEYRGKNTMENNLFAPLVRQGIQLVIILIPSCDDIYNEIKSVAELNLGLITQCLNQDKPYWRDDRGFSPQLITNFFLKINPKCNGVNQVLPQNAKPPLLKSKLMIIGLDVTHPSPTDGLSKSIAACVGSYTRDFDRCFQRIVVQERARKEVVNLKLIVIDLLENFGRANNNTLPNKILVYRDGIGEGDFEKIIRVELGAIKAACAELGRADIKVTYIMVQKRHNTRFLPVRHNPRDKASFQNIKPGTVVDSGVVHHTLFEFYLCSHAGMMGTSRPSKYVVLHDENEVGADELQAATYFLCYLYPRCTKSSSIPPFVAYAHLMAKRARAYLAHLEDRDGQSSASSGSKNEQLAKAQINEYNVRITVKSQINGRMFFI